MKIKMEKLSKVYGDKRVLHNISFDIDLVENQIIGLVGPNGAGKSTLMRLLGGITLENGGLLSLDSSEKRYAIWARENSVYVPAGDRGLRNKLSLRDNLRYFSALRGKDGLINLCVLSDMINQFSANDLIDKQFDQMSTGQKKKASILIAVSVDASVLLLDEPSNGLDIESQEELKHILLYINHDLHKQVVISSHDISLLSKVVDKYVFINEGNKIKEIKNKMNEDTLQKQYDEIYGGA